MPQQRHHSIDIPTFFLYGEAPQIVEDHYLHLEALSDRSRPNNWTIRTHAHADLCHVFQLTRGAGTMTAEESVFHLQVPCTLVMPAGVAHGFHFTPDAEGTVLTICDHYLQELILRERSFAGLFAAPSVLTIDVAAIAPLLTGLRQEMSWIATGHGAAVEAHLLSLLVTLTRSHERARGATDARPGAQAMLVARFREVVERHYRQNLPIGRYTDLLEVTERQLRSACLSVVGQPPSQIIQRRLLLEAKRALLYSNMTVAETAYYLGFNDPAYFSRFFTHATGKSPRSYRNRA